jgi:protein-S-isoprenylcysteine O-methyltransferase Ste14
VTAPARTDTPAARAFVWGGAALFAASLAYFLFSYGVTFRESATGPLAPRDVAIDIALFSVFALHHSLFARTPLRDWVSRVASPQLERSIYVWTASLMLILVCALWRPIPGVAWEVSGPGAWALRAATMAGLLLTLRSAVMIDVWELAGVRPARVPAPRPSSTPDPGLQTPDTGAEHREWGVRKWGFRTDGPYGWVRHPIYSGWILIVFGVTPMTMTRLVFAVVSCAYVLFAIPLEERMLRATSGGAYEAYMRKVRSKLIPGIY